LAALGGFSGVALALDQPDLAARLLGAVDAARQSSGVGRIAQAELVEAIRAATQKRLGSDAFETQFAEGGTIAYDDAMNTALEIAAFAAVDPSPRSAVLNLPVDLVPPVN
jgi:hypothetical protein